LQSDLARTNKKKTKMNRISMTTREVSQKENRLTKLRTAVVQ